MSLPERMRALCLERPRDRAEPELLRVDDTPLPRMGATDVLVEVRACGICGTDVQLVRGTVPHGPRLPQILGHEAAGVVAAVGAEVTDWREGDRVAVMMYRACGRCRYCQAGRDNLCTFRTLPGVDTDGALATYAVADPRSLVPVPGGVSFAQAAIVIDAVASSYHALKRLGIAEGDTIAVFGLGGLGMHALLLAQLAGAEVIGVDIDPVNLERARDWGAEAVVDARDGAPLDAITSLVGSGVERALEFVGSPQSVDEAVRCLVPGGRAVVAGFSPQHLSTLPLTRFAIDEKEVVGSFGSTPQDLGELFDLIEDGRLDLSRSVTHTTDLDGAAAAITALESREGSPIRSVVTDLR